MPTESEIISAIDGAVNAASRFKRFADSVVGDEAIISQSVGDNARLLALAQTSQAEAESQVVEMEEAVVGSELYTATASEFDATDLNRFSLKYSFTGVVDVGVYETQYDDDPNWVNRDMSHLGKEDTLPTGEYVGEYTSSLDAIAQGAVVGDYFFHLTQQRFRVITDEGAGDSVIIHRAGKMSHPKVAIVILTQEGLFVFDGDDPSLPFWMHIPTGNDRPINTILGGEPTCVKFVNGIYYVSTTTRGLAVFDIPANTGFQGVGHGSFQYLAPLGEILEEERSWLLKSGIGAGFTLTSNVVNHISLYLDPASEVNVLTGMRRPVVGISLDTGFNVLLEDHNTVVASSLNLPALTPETGLTSAFDPDTGELYVGTVTNLRYVAYHEWRTSNFVLNILSDIDTNRLDIVDGTVIGFNSSFASGLQRQKYTGHSLDTFVSHSYSDNSLPYMPYASTMYMNSSVGEIDIVQGSLNSTNNAFQLGDLTGFTTDNTGTGTVTVDSGVVTLSAPNEGDRALLIFPITAQVGETFVLDLVIDSIGAEFGPLVIVNDAYLNSRNAYLPPGRHRIGFTVNVPDPKISIRVLDSEVEARISFFDIVAGDMNYATRANPRQSNRTRGNFTLDLVNGYFPSPMAVGTIEREPLVPGSPISGIVTGLTVDNANLVSRDERWKLSGDFSFVGWTKNNGVGNSDILNIMNSIPDDRAGGYEFQPIFKAAWQIASTFTGNTSPGIVVRYGEYTSATGIVGAGAPWIGTWVFFAVTMRNNVMELYINDRLVDTAILPNGDYAWPDGLATLKVGDDRTGSPRITRSNWLRLIDRALNKDEIMEMYNSEYTYYGSGLSGLLPSNQINSIHTDHHGRIAVSTDEGLAIVDAYTGVVDRIIDDSDADLTQSNILTSAIGEHHLVVSTATETKIEVSENKLRTLVKDPGDKGINRTREAILYTTANDWIVDRIFIMPGQELSCEFTILVEEDTTPTTNRITARFDGSFTAQRRSTERPVFIGSPEMRTVYSTNANVIIDVRISTIDHIVEILGRGVDARRLRWNFKLKYS